MKLNAALLLILLLLLPHAAGAQDSSTGFPLDACSLTAAAPWVDVKGVPAELARLTELSGETPTHPTAIRRASGRHQLCGASATAMIPPIAELGPARVRLAPPRTELLVNGGYPDDRQNGLLWAGRGFSGLISGGAVIAAGPVTAGWLPEMAVHTNGDYDRRDGSRPGFSPYVHPFELGIDQPQRFGPDPFSTISLLGQSFARVDLYGLAAGISRENVVVGSAVRNPLLLSAAAPGFTHLFLGTGEPLELWIARLDVQLIMGKLEESDHFDERPDNDQNALALWTVSVSPRWLDGLMVGVGRAYMYRPEDPGSFGDLSQLSGFFSTSSASNLPGNEIAALFARWVMPEAGAEIYGEWGRDDRFYKPVEFFQEPDHSQAYTLGFQKVTEAAGGAVRVQGELTALQEKQEFRTGRPLPTFYTHSGIRQGYTHRGQLLGAPIGTGADAQFIGIDWMDEWGYVGAIVERVRRNDATGAALQARFGPPYEHDTELTGGVRALYLWRDISVSGSLSYSHRWNRDFLQDDQNLKFQLEAVAWPGAFRGR